MCPAPTAILFTPLTRTPCAHQGLSGRWDAYVKAQDALNDDCKKGVIDPVRHPHIKSCRPAAELMSLEGDEPRGQPRPRTFGDIRR